MTSLGEVAAGLYDIGRIVFNKRMLNYGAGEASRVARRPNENVCTVNGSAGAIRDRVHIVYEAGTGCGEFFSKAFMAELKRHGIDASTPKTTHSFLPGFAGKFLPRTSPIQETVSVLNNHLVDIADSVLDRVIIILGYSQGGLVMCQSYDQIPNAIRDQVAVTVGIAAPYHGSRVASALSFIPLGKELSPGSPMLQEWEGRFGEYTSRVLVNNRDILVPPHSQVPTGFDRNKVDELDQGHHAVIVTGRKGPNSVSYTVAAAIDAVAAELAEQDGISQAA